MRKLPQVRHYFGVDFSGAKKAGDNIWIAHVVRASRKRERPEDTPSGRSRSPLALVSLHRLTTLAGTADRGPALAHLVGLVRASRRAVWGFDFPFGLPVELFPAGTRWADQFLFLAEWGDEAYGCGLECVARAKQLADGFAHHRTALHCRRVTDVEAKAPFDTFHYRKVY